MSDYRIVVESRNPDTGRWRQVSITPIGDPARAVIAGYLERLAHRFDTQFGTDGWPGADVVNVLAEDMAAYGVVQPEGGAE